jgi:hypothetical protein
MLIAAVLVPLEPDEKVLRTQKPEILSALAVRRSVESLREDVAEEHRLETRYRSGVKIVVFCVHC